MPTPTRRIQCQSLAETYSTCERLFPFLKVQLGRSADDDCRCELQRSNVGDLVVDDFTSSMQIVASADKEDDELTVVFVEHGANIVERNGREIATGLVGGCAIGPMRAGDVVRIAPNSARRLVRVDSRQIDDLIVRHFHVAPPPSIDFMPSLRAAQPECAILGDIVRHVIAGLASAEGPFASILSKQYSDLFLSSLLLIVPNSFSSALGKAGGVATNRYVKRALDYMRANVEQPIDIDDIARNAACSPRRLQLAFRAQFGVTPIAFLKEERLRLAERRLRTGEYGDVTSLALSLGFSNPGRFAGEFRQKFGVLPSEILGSQPAPARQRRSASGTNGS